jgi:hypothetical protein
MRVVAVALFILPSVCMALGADSEMYIGLTRDGKVIRIGFLSDRQPWSPGEFIYGAKSNPKFRYCWTSSDGSGQSHFVCSSRQGKPPSLSYRHGEYSYNNRTNGIRYKEAMASFKKLKIDEESESMLDYYICEKGCDNTVPRFIFNIGFGGM